MRNGHKLRLLAAATACFMALAMTPATAFAGEDSQCTVEITKECLTAPQDITPGSTLDFKVTIAIIEGNPEDAITETVFTDTWSAGLEPVAGSFAITGSGFTHAQSLSIAEGDLGADSVSCIILSTVDGDSENMMFQEGTAVITYSMKVAEDASGTLTNTGNITGMADTNIDESSSIQLEVVKAAPDTPAADTDADKDGEETETDYSPKTDDTLLPRWLLAIMEKIEGII